ncbi:MAG: glycosyltransferase family 39 protein [Candidatus Auribacterota bacterium]
MKDRLMQNKHLLLLVLIAWTSTLFFINLGEKALWSAQEARNALAAATMLKGPVDEWIIPTIAFEKSTQKPVFFYWLVAVSCWIGQTISALWVRVPSALSGLLSVLYVFLFISRLKDAKTGFITALILSTSVKFLAMSRTSRIDIFLSLCMTITLCELFLFFLNKRRLHLLAATFFTGIAVLCKGPVGLILPGAIIAAFLWTQNDLRSIRLLFHPMAIAVFLLTVLPYYIFATIVTDGSFLYDFIIRHNIERFTGIEGTFGKRKPVWFYIPHLLAGLIPWTLFLPLFGWYYRFEKRIKALFSVRHSASPQDNSFAFFLFIWFACVFAFFSLASFKRSDYILPAYTPAIMLIGVMLGDFSFLKKHRRWLKTIIVAVSIILVLQLPLFFVIGFKQFPDYLFSINLVDTYFNSNDKATLTAISDFIRGHIIVLPVISICILIAGLIVSGKKIRLSLISFAAVAGMSYIFYFSKLEPVVDEYRTLEPFANKVNSLVNPHALVMYHFWNHQLYFYLNREVEVIYFPHEMEEYCNTHDQSFIIAEQKWYDYLSDEMKARMEILHTTPELHSKHLLLLHTKRTPQH